jgi:hypothetical protein
MNQMKGVFQSIHTGDVSMVTNKQHASPDERASVYRLTHTCRCPRLSTGNLEAAGSPKGKTDDKANQESHINRSDQDRVEPPRREPPLEPDSTNRCRAA